MLTITISCGYDGDPGALASAIADYIRSQSGQDITVRVNTLDDPNTVSKIAALNAAQLAKRRPNI